MEMPVMLLSLIYCRRAQIPISSWLLILFAWSFFGSLSILSSNSMSVSGARTSSSGSVSSSSRTETHTPPNLHTNDIWRVAGGGKGKVEQENSESTRESQELKLDNEVDIINLEMDKERLRWSLLASITSIPDPDSERDMPLAMDMNVDNNEEMESELGNNLSYNRESNDNNGPNITLNENSLDENDVRPIYGKWANSPELMRLDRWLAVVTTEIPIIDAVPVHNSHSASSARPPVIMSGSPTTRTHTLPPRNLSAGTGAGTESLEQSGGSGGSSETETETESQQQGKKRYDRFKIDRFSLTNLNMNNTMIAMIRVNNSVYALDRDNKTWELPISMRFNDGHLVSMVIYSILMVISAVGNITVLVTIIRFRMKARLNRVNLFLLHLAIADLLVTFLLMPLEIVWAYTVSWRAGDAMCRIMSFFRIFGIFLSGFLLVCISLDRYFAVLKPLALPEANRRGRIMLSAAWIGSAICSLPQAAVFRVQQHPIVPMYEQCITYGFFTSETTELIYVLFGFFFLYGFPLVTIISCYSCILYEIFKINNLNRLGGEDLRRSNMGALGRAKIRTLKMTVVIVAAFFLCWTPYNIISLWYWIDRESAQTLDFRIQKGLFLFACTNSCVNPIVYGFFHIRRRKSTTNSVGGGGGGGVGFGPPRWSNSNGRHHKIDKVPPYKVRVRWKPRAECLCATSSSQMNSSTVPTHSRIGLRPLCELNGDQVYFNPSGLGHVHGLSNNNHKFYNINGTSHNGHVALKKSPNIYHHRHHHHAHGLYSPANENSGPTEPSQQQQLPVHGILNNSPLKSKNKNKNNKNHKRNNMNAPRHSRRVKFVNSANYKHNDFTFTTRAENGHDLDGDQQNDHQSKTNLIGMDLDIALNYPAELRNNSGGDPNENENEGEEGNIIQIVNGSIFYTKAKSRIPSFKSNFHPFSKTNSKTEKEKQESIRRRSYPQKLAERGKKGSNSKDDHARSLNGSEEVTPIPLPLTLPLPLPFPTVPHTNITTALICGNNSNSSSCDTVFSPNDGDDGNTSSDSDVGVVGGRGFRVNGSLIIPPVLSFKKTKHLPISSSQNRCRGKDREMSDDSTEAEYFTSISFNGESRATVESTL